MNRRTAILYFFICTLALTLVFRLGQLASENDYVEAARTQSSYKLTVSHTRGAIYDRSFRPLAGRMKVFRAVVMPQRDTAARLASKLSREQYVEAGNLLTGRTPFVIDVENGSIAGKDAIVLETEKRYASHSLAVHLVGYTDGSGHGASGIERAFDNYLLEQGGELSVLCRVNAAGRAMVYFEPVISDTTKNSGAGVVTSLSADIQAAAENAMNGKNGAAVVMNMEGELLAGVSTPDFSQDNIAASLSAEGSPLYNRLLASYDIGSVFKLITAAAALENGITSDFSYECTGSVQIGSNIFHCSNREGHGTLNMAQATACSCNTYFIALAQEIGGEKLLQTAERFGFGKEIMLADDMYTEKGRLPSSVSLNNLAALANLSFGQGDLMATPVHIASVINTIAAGGVRKTPSLIIGLTDDGESVTRYLNYVSEERVISEETAALLRSFMRLSVTDGTGRGGASEVVACAAKTGTAQTGMKLEGKSVLQAWYAGFFPYDDPEYICVVVVENGKSGGSDAGPVFREIAESIVSLRLS